MSKKLELKFDEKLSKIVLIEKTETIKTFDIEIAKECFDESIYMDLLNGKSIIIEREE
jgi:hypothetical protein